MFQKILWLSVAGACGTLSRFALCELAAKTGPKHIGTFAVNIIGCFLFGLVYASVGSRLNISQEARTILLVGFMGAFTTFSTFAFDSAQLIKTSQWLAAAWNIIGQVALGVVAMVIGVVAGKALS